MKTKQLGYHTLPNGLKLHFSINCWYALEEQAGLTASQFLKEFGEELSKEDRNEFILLDQLADITYAAATAYSQEEETELDTNRYKIKNELIGLDGQGIIDLAAVIFGTADAEDKLANTGKQKTQAKKIK